MNEIPRILARAYRMPWAVLPAKLEEIRALLLSRADLSDTADEGVRLRAEGRQRYQPQGSVAVINVFGTISQRSNMLSDFSGGTSTELLTKAIREAVADPSVSSIVMSMDTPGGTVDGVPEAHAAIMEARDSKPVVAHVNSMAASAGLWLASAASEKIITPSGSMGSLGVYSLHQDVSGMMEASGVKNTFISAGKYKTEGNPFEPLSDDARAAIQADVDAFYGMFVKGVAKGYGISTKDVEESFGQGRMLLAKDALAAGMVDRIEPLDATISRMMKAKVPANGKRAEELTPAQKLNLLNI